MIFELCVLYDIGVLRMSSTTYILILQVFLMFFFEFSGVLASAIGSGIWKNSYLILFTDFEIDHHLIQHMKQSITSSLTYMTEISVVIRQCT